MPELVVEPETAISEKACFALKSLLKNFKRTRFKFSVRKTIASSTLRNSAPSSKLLMK